MSKKSTTLNLNIYFYDIQHQNGNSPPLIFPCMAPVLVKSKGVASLTLKSIFISFFGGSFLTVLTPSTLVFNNWNEKSMKLNHGDAMGVAAEGRGRGEGKEGEVGEGGGD